MISSPAMTARIAALLIEDDARLAALVAEYLGQNDVDVTIAGDGETGLQLARGKVRFDIVLLDPMLAKLSGPEVSPRTSAPRRIAHAGTIMLTAKGAHRHKVVGLEH